MTAFARFRCYEELNDHLPPERRKKDFAVKFSRGATVGAVITQAGVPLEEVDLVLVNGESVDFTHELGDGDQVSVYPVFERLDITSIVKVRDVPLRHIRFSVDPRFRKLTVYLRMLGFDTILEAEEAPGQARPHISGNRVRLTPGSPRENAIRFSHHIPLQDEKPRRQLLHVLARLDLRRAAAPFSRCLRCNAQLTSGTTQPDHGSSPPRFGFPEEIPPCPRCGNRNSGKFRKTRMEWFLKRVLAMQPES